MYFRKEDLAEQGQGKRHGIFDVIFGGQCYIWGIKGIYAMDCLRQETLEMGMDGKVEGLLIYGEDRLERMSPRSLLK